MHFDRPLRVVRRRLRLQAALDGAARAAVLAAALLLAAVYLWRLGVLGGRGLGLAIAGTLAVVAAGALARALRAIPLSRAALAVDASHGLHDRLRSALAFAGEPEPTPFMTAAIADAERVAGAVEPRRAAPFARPAALTPAGVLALVAGVVALLHFPARTHFVAAAPLPPRLVVDRAALEPELAAAAELAALAKQGGDPATEEMAQKINQILQQIDAQELTRKQAFDKLAELENKYLRADGADLEALREKLRKAGAALEKSKALAPTGRALKQEDLAQARKELEKLAAQAEQRAAEPKPDSKYEQQQREEMARALADAAKQEQQHAEDKKKQDEEQRLKEEERKLRQQLAQKPKDEELQRKLERNQRELQRLEREKQEQAERQRQLQRLQRELEKAAEQLRQKMSPEALKQLAKQMQEMQDEMRKLGNAQRVQMQIAEIKEVLRRVGRSQSGSGGQQQQPGQGKDQQAGKSGQQGKAQGKGKGGKGNEQLQEFEKRADGKGNMILLGEKDPQNGNGPSLLLPMPMGPGQQQPGPNGNGDERPGGGGDGIGDQHDANLLGDKTRLAARARDTRVEGHEGAGPSRSQTILGSAEKGFASTSYKRVYGDYTAVVEEVMSKEKVPPGYRFYIKRYFQLIKPRE
jgi:hypothetical protein